MLLRGVGPARIYRLLGKARGLMENDPGYSLNLQGLSEKLSPNGSSLKTSLRCTQEGSTRFSESLPKAGMMRHGQLYPLPLVEQVTLEEESGFWPTPTVQDAENNGGPAQHARNTLAVNAAIMYPEHILPAVLNNKTARAGFFHWAIDQLSLGQSATMIRSNAPADLTTLLNAFALGQQKTDSSIESLARICMDAGVLTTGKTNPVFVEWLMGWPTGWTESGPLATDKFQSWLQQHGEYLKVLSGVSINDQKTS